MTTIVESIGSRARAWPGVATDAVSIVLGSLLIAALAQIAFRLPFTPVPVTGQTLGVLLVGGSLGARRGVAAVLLYLAEGAVSLPFFAAGAHGVDLLRFSAATGGYLWGFAVAALAVGFLSERGWDRSIRSSLGAMLLGEIVIYAFGVSWLGNALGVGSQKALELGLYPFVLGDVVKLLVAAGVLPAAWKMFGPRS